MQERYKLQSKELKDAVSQRKMAMGEFAEVNDRLSEMRTAKQGLSRQVSFWEKKEFEIITFISLMIVIFKIFLFFLPDSGKGRGVGKCERQTRFSTFGSAQG